jgi:hypothetical protein
VLGLALLSNDEAASLVEQVAGRIIFDPAAGRYLEGRRRSYSVGRYYL